MKNGKWLLFAAFVSLAFFACKKGDTGPAGAKGPAGSANVQYSSWNALSLQFSGTDSAYEQKITADSLTQAVLDSGLVLTYLKYTPSSGQSIVVNASSYLQEIFSAGSIQLFSRVDYSGFEYRYIIIPGGVHVERAASGST